MLKENLEYKQLLDLRSVLIGKQQAQQQIDVITRKKTQLKFTLPQPEQREPIAIHTKEIIKQFRAPLVAKEISSARKRDAAARKVKAFFFVIAALFFLVIGSIGTYFSAIWSWNTSITGMISTPYMNEIMPYEVAVGIHLFALTIILAIIAVALGMLAYNEKLPGLLYAGMAFAIVLGAISLIASFAYFYSAVSGFWETLLMFFASFLYIPKLFVALFYVLLFMIVLSLTIFMTGLFIYRCIILFMDPTTSYKAPTVDMSELYKTKEYKDAEERDRLATEQDRKIYRNYYTSAKQNYNQQITSYQNAINQYQRIIDSCTKEIQKVDILHNNQKNLSCVDTILCYFEMRRAITIREALNLYAQDQQLMRIQNQLDALQKETVRTLKQEVGKLSTRLDQMQTNISKDIAMVNNTLNTQTATLEKSIERLRKDNNKNAQQLLEAEQLTASRVGELYYEARFQRIHK